MQTPNPIYRTVGLLEQGVSGCTLGPRAVALALALATLSIDFLSCVAQTRMCLTLSERTLQYIHSMQAHRCPPRGSELVDQQRSLRSLGQP